MPAEWYALKSKPNKENLLLDQLLIRKVETYFPRIHVRPVNPRACRIKAFFPGYLFVQIDLTQVAVSNLAWIPGASRLVCFDSEPASIPENLINLIRKKVDAINSVGGELIETLKSGDRILVHSGPFAGFDGIFDKCLDGNDRVRVLLNLIQNRQLRLEIPRRQVQPQEFH